MRKIAMGILLVACGSDQSREGTPPPSNEAPVAATTEPVREAPTPREMPAADAPPDVADWGHILQTYVTADGGFRYAALHGNAADRERLQRYVAAVGEASPDEWSRDAQLAFYIDAYNALTVSAVLERWPLESVMNIDGFFDGIEHRVAGTSRTLNGLEGDVIRGEAFSEPRIHFAVNCASTSCPPLSRTPFTAENLQAQLASLTDAFVGATTRVASRRLHVSKLFEWYADDFGGAAGVREFLAAHLEGEAAEAASNERIRLQYDDYDWAVNARE